MGFEHTITNLPIENEYPKLVRDRIPDIVKINDGVDVPVRSLEDDEEYLTYLLKKIAEEAGELAGAKTDSNIKEEIADVYEVVQAIVELKSFSKDELVAIRNEKRHKRGGFSKRLLMLEKP